jgi:hypothetical protein
MKNHHAVKTHVWKKSTTGVSGSASPKDNFNSFGDIGPSHDKSPQPINQKVNNSFGDIGPSCYKPPPTNPTSTQGAQKSVRSKEGAWQNSCACSLEIETVDDLERILPSLAMYIVCTYMMNYVSSVVASC